MAILRVYRHYVRCPECVSNWMPKAGSVNGCQVYRCGKCQRRYTPYASYHRLNAYAQERALAMYREGSSMRAVAWVFGGSARSMSLKCGKKERAVLPRIRRQSRERTAGRR